MKISKLHLLPIKHQSSAGFTIIELLVSIAIVGVTSSLISYAVGSMISSNQNLGKEQNRRVEITRALDLIVRDIKSSTVSPVSGLSSDLPIIGTPILSLQLIDSPCSGAEAYKNRIVYSIQSQPATNKTALGPNVLYRSGLITTADGTLDCSSSADPTPIADAVSLGTMIAPSCGPTPAIPDDKFYSTGANGFYSCVNDNQVTVAILTKFSGNKIYGVSQTANSSSAIVIPETEPESCTVPRLIEGKPGEAALSPDAAQAAVTNNRLRYYRINTESGGTKVLTQTPLAGSKLPCDKGLVIYTY
jgi:prepilin-type N-terminal cleavage/methylation domain-containing protein